MIGNFDRINRIYWIKKTDSFRYRGLARNAVYRAAGGLSCLSFLIAIVSIL